MLVRYLMTCTNRQLIHSQKLVRSIHHHGLGRFGFISYALWSCQRGLQRQYPFRILFISEQIIIALRLKEASTGQTWLYGCRVRVGKQSNKPSLSPWTRSFITTNILLIALIHSSLCTTNSLVRFCWLAWLRCFDCFLGGTMFLG
jgi:hypothetical protein